MAGHILKVLDDCVPARIYHLYYEILYGFEIKGRLEDGGVRGVGVRGWGGRGEGFWILGGSGGCSRGGDFEYVRLVYCFLYFAVVDSSNKLYITS